MKLQPDTYTVDEMIGLVEDGRLALPDFQRGFVWSPALVADLLVSVARKWPVGTLLLLEGPADFAVRALHGAPELTEARLLVLDGQQRITALYQALGNRRSDEVFVVDFAALSETEELGDEHIRARRRTSFTRQYPDLKRRARAGVITLEELIDDGIFAKWVDDFDSDGADAFALRKQQLGGLLHYPLQAVRLERDIPMAALAKIFETINRRGERLKAFDLMVARLYPHQFNLKERWREAVAEHPVLADFSIDGLDVLRLIALHVHVSQHRDPAVKTTVRGIRQGDVLDLDAEIVREQWSWAVHTLVAALMVMR